MHKLVVLYPEPADRQAFIDYYEATHLPLAAKLPGLTGWRYSVEVPPEGKAVTDDVPNYATGGAVVLDYAVAASGASK